MILSVLRLNLQQHPQVIAILLKILLVGFGPYLVVQLVKQRLILVVEQVPSVVVAKPTIYFLLQRVHPISHEQLLQTI